MRYDSKSNASWVLTLAEFVLVRYQPAREDMTQLMGRFVRLVEKLQRMGAPLHDTLTTGMIVLSIDMEPLMPITASAKVLRDRSVTWEDMTSRFVEEYNTLGTGNVSHGSANSAQHVYRICKGKGYTLDRCFYNPLNSNNRLDVKEPVQFQIR